MIYGGGEGEVGPRGGMGRLMRPVAARRGAIRSMPGLWLAAVCLVTMGGCGTGDEFTAYSGDEPGAVSTLGPCGDCEDPSPRHGAGTWAIQAEREEPIPGMDAASGPCADCLLIGFRRSHLGLPADVVAVEQALLFVRSTRPHVIHTDDVVLMDSTEPGDLWIGVPSSVFDAIGIWRAGHAKLELRLADGTPVVKWARPFDIQYSGQSSAASALPADSSPAEPRQRR